MRGWCGGIIKSSRTAIIIDSLNIGLLDVCGKFGKFLLNYLFSFPISDDTGTDSKNYYNSDTCKNTDSYQRAFDLLEAIHRRRHIPRCTGQHGQISRCTSEKDSEGKDAKRDQAQVPTARQIMPFYGTVIVQQRHHILQLFSADLK